MTVASLLIYTSSTVWKDGKSMWKSLALLASPCILVRTGVNFETGIPAAIFEFFRVHKFKKK